MNEVYLDNSSTTRVCETAAAKVMELMTENYGNPSSLHALGFRAEQALTQARRSVAAALGAKEEEVFFTSGGTESNNLAIFGAAYARKRMGMHIVTTQIEHPSVANAVRQLEKEGWEVTWLQPDREGHIAPEAVLEAVRPDTTLVSMMAVNNEVGTILPIEAAARAIALKKAPALLHVDAVQAFGKYPIDVEKMKIDLLTMSGHKIHGPKGVGMLYMRKGLKVKPLMLGGGQQRGQRPGTENGPGAAALGVACDEAFKSMKESIAHVREVKQTLLEGILALPDTQLNGDSLEEASPYVLNVTFKGLRSEVLLHALESKGIVVSAGSACDSKKKVGSPVLTAMGLPFSEIEGAIRFSFCRYNTVEEAKECLKALEELVPFFRKYNR